jgi:PKD repeat protein
MHLMKKRVFTDHGASEIIGAVMLISVVVMGVAIIGVVLTSQPPPQNIPALDAVISWDGIDTIYIAHNGGDTLRKGEFYIQVDNEVKPFLKTNEPGNPSWTSWSAGESLDYKLGSSDPRPPRLVQVIYKGTGTSGVMLASTNFGTGGSPSGMPTQVPTVIPPVGGSPVITGITPDFGTNGTTVIITRLAGAGFTNGAAVRLTRAGQPDIPGTSVFFISSSQLSCTFNLNTLATGSWDVIVTNPDGKTSNSFPFTVIPPPTVTSITPNYGNSSTVVTVTNLAGTRFQPGAAVKLTSGIYPDITATAVNYVSPTQLTCSFNLAFATAGVRNVVVTNPDGKSATLVNGFTVMPPLVAPTVSGINPATGSAGSTVKITNLQGTGFVTGATVKLNMTVYPDIAATDVIVVNPNIITCNISIPAGATPWPRNVVVTNIDGQNGMLSSGFTITGVAPTPTGITPSSGSAGSVIYNVNIAGTGFASGAAVTLNRTSVSGIDATNVVVSSPTLIICDISIPAGTSSGQWNVSVSNTDGKNGILVNGFTVTSIPPVPVTADFTGTPVLGNAPLTVQFVDTSTGSPTEYLWNFGDTQTSTLKNPSHIYASSSGSPFTVSLRVGNGTSLYNTSTKMGYITVNAAPIPSPQITTVTPATVRRNVNTLITIDGTGFQSSGTTEVLFRRHGTTTIIAGSVVTYISPTRITCMFRSANTVGLIYDVQVINPDYQTAIDANAITTIA